MLKISTLRGQITISIVLSLPFPIIFGWESIDALNLLIQLVGMSVLFGIIKNGKGFEFKVMRIFIATLLWSVFWIVVHHPLLIALKQDYGVDRFLPKVVFVASYNAMVIAMVVLFSYVIGKWINDKIVKKKTLFSKSTLLGQIAICSLLFFPIPVVMMVPKLFEVIFTFLIPVVIFCVVFWMENSTGAEFKVTRITIATLLWGAFYLSSYGHYQKIMKWLGLELGDTDYYLDQVLHSCYYVMGIAMAVLFSYVIGKWLNITIVKKGSTLKGQIAICSLLFLPIPAMTMIFFHGLEYYLTFLIPIGILCKVFWKENSKGAEFKVTRIVLATLLWVAFHTESYVYGKYWEMLKWLGLGDAGSKLGQVLYSSYNAMGIAMVVILSYVIGKWINSKIGDQINEKRE